MASEGGKSEKVAFTHPDASNEPQSNTTTYPDLIKENQKSIVPEKIQNKDGPESAENEQSDGPQKVKITIDSNTMSKIVYWPTSRNVQSRLVDRAVTESIKPTDNSIIDDDEPPMAKTKTGKYIEIPHLLDGFRMLNRAPAEDPEEVYAVDVSSQNLLYVIEDDLTLFLKLHTFRGGENKLPFARLGVLPNLRKLILPYNSISSLDLDVDGRFLKLEFLDLSYNAIDHSAQLVLSTLPNLKHLDLTNNSIGSLTVDILYTQDWRDKVIELLLPTEVALLDAKYADSKDGQPTQNVRHTPGGRSLYNYLDSKHGSRKASNRTTPHPGAKNVIEPSADAPVDVKKEDDDQQTASESTSDESKSVEQEQHHDDANVIPAPVPNVGFKLLDTLVLEGNHFGSSGNDTFWFILSQLPSLRSLNLNRNHIQTLLPLIPATAYPENATEKDPIHLLSVNPQILVKYQGFQSLNDLYLTHNKLANLRDILGLLCLPKVSRVFLEGNKVMKQYTPKHLVPRDQTRQFDQDTDIFTFFSSTYGINVSDFCFAPPKSTIDSVLVNVAGLNERGALATVQQSQPKKIPQKRPHFIGNYLSKKTHVQVGHHVIPHIVKDISLSTPQRIIQQRQQRRHYQFTDEDLQEIVKHGRIPPVKELVRLADERQKREDQGEVPTIEQIESTQDPNAVTNNADGLKVKEPRKHPESSGAAPTNLILEASRNTKSLQTIMFDPDRVDDTFLTGVHITKKTEKKSSNSRYDDDADGSGSDATGSSSGSSSSEGDSEGDSSDSDSSSSFQSVNTDIVDDSHMDRVYPLPVGIQSTTRALRHALMNPVSYWRVLEESYARPTYASLKRDQPYVLHSEIIRETKQAVAETIQTPPDGEFIQPNAIGQHDDYSQTLKDELFGEVDEVQAYKSPANSVWTPQQMETDVVPLADYISPATFNEQPNRAPRGKVQYRYREELQNSIDRVHLLSRERKRLEKQLELQLKSKKKSNKHQVVQQNPAVEKHKYGVKQLSTKEALQRAKVAGRLRPQNDFDEMDQLMTFVDDKLHTIEINISKALADTRLMDHWPKSKKLMQELDDEYTRIETLYLHDAKNIVKSEPLSQRLQKLGIKPLPHHH